MLQLPSTERTPDSSEDQSAERKSEIQANDFIRTSERVREVSKFFAFGMLGNELKFYLF